jgi:hypothetical protein
MYTYLHERKLYENGLAGPVPENRSSPAALNLQAELSRHYSLRANCGQYIQLIAFPLDSVITEILSI